MEPKVTKFYRVKLICYRTEEEARAASAGLGEWGGDYIITPVELLEWDGKLWKSSHDKIEALPAEILDLYRRLGHAEFAKFKNQMRNL